MKMPNISSILEFITFDIILLGFITLLFLYVLRALLDTSLYEWPHKKIHKGWTDIMNRFGNWSKTGKSIGYLLLAAALGLCINLMADEFLDARRVIQKFQ
jgi:hypothetical protein